MQLSGNFTYSFLLGVLAAVNPCGFAMLPNYLLYFLGTDSPDRSTRSSVQQSLRVGLSVSSGFLVVFLVVGVISRVFTQWIEQNAKYAALAIGVLLVITGIKMFSGWKPRFMTPNPMRSLDRDTKSMFIYGVIYAIASIGCTIGFLTTAVFGSFATYGLVSGVVSVVLYGLGMSLLVTALTVTLGLARLGLVSSIRGILPYVTRASAVLTVLTGLYLSWYWFVAITERSSLGPLASRVESAQTRLATLLQDIGGRGLALILCGVIVGAVILGRRRQSNQVGL
ncbi:MAG: cytochrome c biogenesis CcdA family protein [Candidatus Nanopelagicaceae bacterium]